MAIVVFDPAAFKAEYPEFAAVTDARCVSLFDMAAASVLDNTDGSPVMALPYRTQLFFLLVAHMLAIFGAGAAGSSGAIGKPVGRLSTATEGSVTAAFAYELPVGSAMAAWYNQTPYGALYWMMTAQFRSLRYHVSGDSGTGVARDFNAAPFNVPGGVPRP